MNRKEFLRLAGIVFAGATVNACQRHPVVEGLKALATSTPIPEIPTAVPGSTNVPDEEIVTPVATESPTVLGAKEKLSGQVMETKLWDPLKWLDIHNRVTLVRFFASNDVERQQLSEMVEPGKGTAAMYEINDGFGSLMLTTHSGFYDGQPLEAEGLREYVQGGKVDVATLSRSDERVRMNNLIGQTVEITINGEVRQFEVFYVQRISYGQSLNSFRQNGAESLNVARQLDKKDNKGVSALDSLSGPVLGINWCGWARKDELDQLRKPEDQWQ